MDNHDFRPVQNGKLHSTTAATNGKSASPKSDTGRLAGGKISLEAVINVLVQKGLCTEEQLRAEEARLRAVQHTMAHLHFKPVRVTRKSPRPASKHSLKRWAAQRRWARKLGSILFGWRFQKYKKKERSGSSQQNPYSTS